MVASKYISKAVILGYDIHTPRGKLRATLEFISLFPKYWYTHFLKIVQLWILSSSSTDFIFCMRPYKTRIHRPRYHAQIDNNTSFDETVDLTCCSFFSDIFLLEQFRRHKKELAIYLQCSHRKSGTFVSIATLTKTPCSSSFFSPRIWTRSMNSWKQIWKWYKTFIFLERGIIYTLVCRFTFSLLFNVWKSMSSQWWGVRAMTNTE